MTDDGPARRRATGDRSGGGLEPAFLVAVREPREAGMLCRFTPVVARYARLRTTSTDASAWSVAELRVHAPAPR